MLYELMTDMAWRGAPADTKARGERLPVFPIWGEKRRRRGRLSQAILDNAYAVPFHEGPINSVITGRPSSDKNLKGRTWSPGSRVPYDTANSSARGAKQLCCAAPETPTPTA